MADSSLWCEIPDECWRPGCPEPFGHDMDPADPCHNIGWLTGDRWRVAPNLTATEVTEGDPF